MLLLLLVMLAELDVLLGMLKVVVLLLVVDLLLLLPLLILCRLLLLLPLLVLNWMLLVMLLVLLLVLLLRHSRVLVTVVALVVVEVVRRVGHCHHRRRPIGGLPVPRRRRPLPPYAAVSVAVHRHDEVRVVVVARGRRHHHPVLTVAVHHAGGGRHASSSSERSSAHPTLLQGREKISHTLGRVVDGSEEYCCNNDRAPSLCRFLAKGRKEKTFGKGGAQTLVCQFATSPLYFKRAVVSFLSPNTDVPQELIPPTDTTDTDYLTLMLVSFAAGRFAQEAVLA